MSKPQQGNRETWASHVYEKLQDVIDEVRRLEGGIDQLDTAHKKECNELKDEVMLLELQVIDLEAKLDKANKNQVTRLEHMSDEKVATFIENAKEAGLFTREYEGEIYRRALARASAIIWNHMCALDTGNIKGWMGCARLANIWAETSWSGGARKFGPEDNR